MRRLLIVHNPIAGTRHRRRYQATLAALQRAGCASEVHHTTGRGDAEDIARRRHSEFDAVVVAGGDGTINEAVNGLAGSSTPLGILPLGTANVLAAEIGLTLDPQRVAGVLANGATRPVYPGIANGRRFLLMAGIGFDARAVARIDPALKRRIGKGAYVVAAMQEWWDDVLPRYAVEIDGQAAEVASIIVAKGRCYGGKFVLAPNADLGRPSFETCVLPQASRGTLLGVAGALALHAPVRLTALQMHAAERVRIRGPGGEPVQADGDIVAHLPVDITIERTPLQLLAPYP